MSLLSISLGVHIIQIADKTVAYKEKEWKGQDREVNPGVELWAVLLSGKSLALE